MSFSIEKIAGGAAAKGSLLKNKNFWIIGGIIVVVAVIFSKRSSSEEKELIYDDYPKAPEGMDESLINQIVTDQLNQQRDGFTDLIEGIMDQNGELKERINEMEKDFNDKLAKKASSYSGGSVSYYYPAPDTGTSQPSTPSTSQPSRNDYGSDMNMEAGAPNMENKNKVIDYRMDAWEKFQSGFYERNPEFIASKDEKARYDYYKQTGQNPFLLDKDWGA